MSHQPLSHADRRDGPTDRRMRERAPSSDRRSPEASAGDSYLRPPVSADASAPPTEDTQLLFERS